MPFNFDLPPTDTSLTAARMLEFTPISQGINPMEFVVPAVDAFIDLNRSYFTMKIRLKQENGTDLANDQLLYPANNLVHTLIKQLTCHLNGALISPQIEKLWLQGVSGNCSQLHRERRPHPLANARVVPDPT